MNTPLHPTTSSTFVPASASTSTRYRDRYRDRDPSKHESSYCSYKAFRRHLFQQQQQQPGVGNQKDQKRPLAMDKNRNKKTHISINVIADNQDVIVPLPNTIYNPTLSHSLLTKAAAVATQGQIKTLTTLDSTNQNQTITLRWHYASGLQSWQETFFVVDSILLSDVDGRRSGRVDAMLRGGIDVKPVAEEENDDDDDDDAANDADGAHDAAGAVVAQAIMAFPTFQGKYKKGEKEEWERKEKERRERYERELLRDKEGIRKGIEAAKKKIRLPPSPSPPSSSKR